MTDTAFTEAREQALAAQKAIQDAQAQLAESIKDALKDGLAPYFDKYPFLGSIAWAQYTPYFNDGDTCVFSSNFPEVSFNSVTDVENEEAAESGYEDGPDFGSKSEEETYNYVPGGDSGYVKNENAVPEYVECRKEVEKFLESLVFEDGKRNYDSPSVFDSALLSAFGDHATVTLTRDGQFVVDEYYHD